MAELTQATLEQLRNAPPAPLPPRVRAGMAAAAGRGRALGMAEGGVCSVVTNTTPFPFAQTALLKINMENSEPQRGTAFFISERLLLTAGHNVLSDVDTVKSIEVMPGFNGSAGGTVIDTTDFEASAAYQNSFAFEDDFGVIALSDPFTKVFFGAHAPTNAELPGLSLRLEGYPHADLRQVDCRGGVDIDNTTAQLLFHNIPTHGGHSGAPLWTMVNHEPLIVGIHVAGNPLDGIAAAVRVRSSVRDQILAWLSSM